ncbi:MAG: hypothetical protein P1V35_09950 [Planctomycetota bacterium]|nr:hypothetical protein [Planctomycetota bacterium]
MNCLRLTPALLALIACQSTEPAVLSVDPYPMEYEIGASDFPFGDHITIDRVLASSSHLLEGTTLTVHGTYDLRSRDEATLYLGTTATEDVERKPKPEGELPNHSKVLQGQGSFVMQHTIPGPGYPHVTFYDLETGKPFGGSYFGNGDTLFTERELWYGRAPGE